MDMRERVRDGYERGDYASVFRTSEALPPFEKRMVDAFLERIPVRGEILDLGCGIGIPFDRYFVGKDQKVTGVDVSTKHLAQARENVPQAQFLEGDLSTVEFDRTFDGIASFYAIFHIPREEHEAFFSRMHRLLTPNGILLITLGARADESVDDDWCGAPMAWSSHDPETYRRILERTGFTILTEGFEGEPEDTEHHFWMLAQVSS